MADFSKEYCELIDSELLPDFSIKEEWKKLEIGESVNLICEGFGFISIGKNPENKCVLLFRISHALILGLIQEIPQGLTIDDCVWIEYEFFLINFKDQIN